MTLSRKGRKKTSLILAPMAGVTDLPFRLLCKEFGADILYSEMVSATGFYYNKAKNLRFINSCPQDSPLYIQLFGSDPKHFAKAARMIDSLPSVNEITDDRCASRRPEGIDINFGCPVKKVMKQNSGCALMKNPTLSHEIIRSVIENTTLPVSIKIRAGMDGYGALNFLEKVADLKWKSVIVHARTFSQGFSGSADLDLIRTIKKTFPHKNIIANGGIFAPEDSKRVLDATNADGIAIARGALGNPWIFNQIKTYLASGEYIQPSTEEIKNAAMKHLGYFLKYNGERTIREMRKHLGWYFQGLPQSKKLRKQIFSVSSSEDIKSIVKLLQQAY
ncbi:MAG: tRNA-dihydrouridine synthase [Patescibacteria group bacterium]|nr:tRNA-dihydrouridine synthase [Patescibacteria group bacterium]